MVMRNRRLYELARYLNRTIATTRGYVRNPERMNIATINLMEQFFQTPKGVVGQIAQGIISSEELISVIELQKQEQ
jgi:hypothetical protein